MRTTLFKVGDKVAWDKRKRQSLFKEDMGQNGVFVVSEVLEVEPNKWHPQQVRLQGSPSWFTAWWFKKVRG